MFRPPIPHSIQSGPAPVEEEMWNANPATDLGDLVRGIPEQNPRSALRAAASVCLLVVCAIAALEMARRDADAGLPVLDAYGPLRGRAGAT